MAPSERRSSAERPGTSRRAERPAPPWQPVPGPATAAEASPVCPVCSGAAVFPAGVSLGSSELPLGLGHVTYVDFTAGAGVKQTRTGRERRISAPCSVDCEVHLSPPQRPGEDAGLPARPPSWARQSLGLYLAQEHIEMIFDIHIKWHVLILNTSGFIYTFRGHEYIQLPYPRDWPACEKFELGSSSVREAVRCKRIHSRALPRNL